MDKRRYRVDEANRLTVYAAGRYRPVNGAFAIDEENRLVYEVRESRKVSEEYGLTRRIVFEGTWSLDPGHDLVFILEENDTQAPTNPFVLKGKLLDAGRDELSFEMATIDTDGATHIRLLNLKGVWQADDRNRLTFTVQRKAGPDTLILCGTWQLDDNQQIEYTYEKTSGARGSRERQTLTFTGYWQIGSRDRIVYYLEEGPSSRFEFRVQLQSRSLYPQKGVIKYCIGVGQRPRGASRTRVLVLYGTWKLSDLGGLSFEMEYGAGRTAILHFGVEVAVRKDDRIAFALLDEGGRPLGFSLTYSHAMLKENAPHWFLRFVKTGSDSRVEAGAQVSF